MKKLLIFFLPLLFVMASCSEEVSSLDPGASEKEGEVISIQANMPPETRVALTRN